MCIKSWLYVNLFFFINFFYSAISVLDYLQIFTDGIQFIP